MPRIKRSSIDNLRQRVSLVDVASAYTRLKKAGSQYKGLSPFSEEKTPSFFINPTKNVYTCYSSGNSGDLFHFVQQKENLNFHEAIETLAKRYNVAIEYEKGDTPPEQISLRKELLDIHETACEYYHQQLSADTPAAQSMRQYWTEQRGFPLAVAEAFKIGMAPVSDQQLIQKLTQQGFSTEAIRQSGLFYVRDNSHSLLHARPRFRGRLMIPIRDVQGRVVAFTARKTALTPSDDPSHEAKYINSPETPVFVKSSILFNLDRARQHLNSETPLIVVEGQLDAIRCWHCQIPNVVAPQGTAITEKQMRLARRYVAQIDCLLDGDSAGQKAALRMLPIAFSAGLEVRFIVLPPGCDPDTLLTQGGTDALAELPHTSSMQFAVDSLLGTRTLNPQQKLMAIREIFNIIQECDSEIVKQDYLHQLAEITKIGVYTLVADFETASPKKTGSPEFSKKNQENSSEKLTSAEYVLLYIALNDERLASRISEQLNPEWIKTEKVEGRLLARIMQEHRENLWEGISNCEHLFENEAEKNYFYRVFNQDFIYDDPVKETNINLKKIFLDFCNKTREQVDNELLNTPDNATDQINQLHRKRMEIRRLTQNPPELAG